MIIKSAVDSCFFDYDAQESTADLTPAVRIHPEKQAIVCVEKLVEKD